ncbi:MAG: Zinc-type alcohol dehydrogenase-like protein [Chlamydiae bacterium]|nr:Zinc-type alcohol dehydrogenase-like protein [Chlamydiota bacterium]
MMRAVVTNTFGGPEVLCEKELPIPKPSRDEVRVKISAIGLNPIDVKLRGGMIEIPLPQVLGCDFSGVIDAVGDRCTEYSEGDEVFGFASGPCSNGSYAEYLCIAPQLVVKKPKELSFDQAAGVSVTYLTAFQAMVGTGILQKERPFFLAGGCGGVGSAAISLAKAYEAGPIFTTAGSEEGKKYLVERFGLNEENILNYRKMGIEEMAEILIKKNEGKFYFCFDCVGGAMKELCFSVCDVNGHLASILPEEKDFPIPFWGRDSLIFQRSLSVHMILMLSALGGGPSSWNTYKVQLEHLASLFAKKELLPPHVEVVGSFSEEAVREGHRRLEAGEIQGKLVISVADSTGR